MPGMGTPMLRVREIRRARAAKPSDAARHLRAASLTNSRKSVATSSLRLRPVCSLKPSGPSRSTSAISTKWCTSSAGEASSQPGSAAARCAIASSAASVCFSLRRAQNAGLLDRARPGAVHRQLVRQQAPVERERALKLVEQLIRRPVEPPAPQLACASGLLRLAHGDRLARRRRHRQREQIDEAFGVLGVVARHGKAGEILAIERIGRLCDA